MKIALDAAGGDFGLRPNIEGAIQAASELGVGIILVGEAQAVRSELASRGIPSTDERFEIVDAPEHVGMDEDPVAACREKPRASIMVAHELVATRRADAVVSCGNSGAVMVAALWHLKRLPGVLRPAILAPIPTARGVTVLLDAGANTECKPWHLLQFAMMGTLYAKHVLKIQRPTVGLLSNGEEESKGNDLVHETIPLLKYSGLDFKGPIEGRDLPAGTTDVVVTDGFTGNVVLKCYEGVAGVLLAEMRAEIEKSPISRLGGLLIRGAARNLKRRMSYDEYGGAPLLGVGGTTIICHGKSNAKAVFNAHRVARELVAAKTNEHIKTSLEEMKANLELAKVGQ
ncbi:MAG: phosphate acyltransferase PlsX [Elusimicrobia bacterium]|nr:phosphate acyltransferase PlsX [Elusimicrobiota bacterium]